MFRKAISRFMLASICTPEMAERYKKAKAELSAVRSQIEGDFWASPVGKVVMSSGSGNKPKVEFDEKNGYLIVEQLVNFIEDPFRTQTIEPSVLNQLLNSKLLTDEEKRSLLQEQGILKPKEVTPTPEC